MSTRKTHLAASEEGTTAIEYALIAGLVALTLIGGLGSVAESLLGLPMPALIAAFEGALS
jgi:Flp pilus assembly pilin Flp